MSLPVGHSNPYGHSLAQPGPEQYQGYGYDPGSQQQQAWQHSAPAGGYQYPQPGTGAQYGYGQQHQVSVSL